MIDLLILGVAFFAVSWSAFKLARLFLGVSDVV